MAVSRVFLLIVYVCVFLNPLAAAEPVPASEEEALFVRRIVEFWKDQEYSLAKAQIRDFFKRYPQSEFNESFWVILGDIYHVEKAFEKALDAYAQVRTPSLQSKTLANQASSYYQLQRYVELNQFLEPFLQNSEYLKYEKLSELFTFYYAESLFRQVIGQGDSSENRQQCRLAQTFYEKVQEGRFSKQSKGALAEIHRSLGNYREAALLYQQLVDLSPEKKEEMLFQTASMQMRYNIEDAAETFSQVFKMKGSREQDAAYNWMLLTFDLKKYEMLVGMREKLLESVPLDRLSYAHFILGNSFYALQKYEEAIKEQQAFLAKEKEPSEEMKEALLITVASSFHLEEGKVLNLAVSLLEKIFPDDLSLAKALYFRALYNKKEENEDLLEQDLQRIIAKFPQFESIDSVYFELCSSLYRKGLWGASREAFSQFIKDFPSSSYVPAAQRFMLNTSIHLVDHLEDPLPEQKRSVESSKQEQLRSQLVSDIHQALDMRGVIAEEKVAGYRFKLAKTLFDMGDYASALGVLERYIAHYNENEDLYKAHLLLALCYREGNAGLEGFVFHGERALSLHPDLLEKDRIRLNLFTGYLSLAREVEDPVDSQRYLSKAAEHLYTVIVSDHSSVKLENRLWLANFYFDKIQQHMEQNWSNYLASSGLITEAERARDIFEKALGISKMDGFEGFFLDERTTFLELEAFKLAHLFGWLNQWEAKRVLLEKLNAYHMKFPHWSWSLKGKVMLAVAEVYEREGQIYQAVEKYKALAEMKGRVDPYSKSKAQLQLSRLSFAALESGQVDSREEELAKILQGLKDLQIKKRLAHEPVHLEAALDYAEIASAEGRMEEKEEKLLFHLNRLKEDFVLHEDIWSKDYEASRKVFPEKDLVYQAYMMLVDARIAQLQAKKARENGSMSEAISKEKAARSILSNLKKGKFAVSHYLVEKANEYLRETDPQRDESYETAN